MKCGLLVVVTCCQFAFAQSGQISGKVTALGTTALDRLYVYWTRPAVDKDDKAATSGGTYLAKDGAYSFATLAPGTYLMCAAAPHDLGLVDTCEWTLALPTVTLAAASSRAAFNITMERGSIFEFVVKDFLGLLPTPDRKTAASTDFELGLRSASGLRHQARFVSKGTQGSVYRIVVPYGKPVRAVAFGTAIDVFDDQGKGLPELAQKAAEPVTVADGEKTRVIEYRLAPAKQ